MRFLLGYRGSKRILQKYPRKQKGRRLLSDHPCLNIDKNKTSNNDNENTDTAREGPADTFLMTIILHYLYSTGFK